MAGRWSRPAGPSSGRPSSVTWYGRGRVSRAPDCHVLAGAHAARTGTVQPGPGPAPGHSVVPGMNTSDAARSGGSLTPAPAAPLPAAGGYGTLTVAAVPIGRPGDASPLLAQALAAAPLVAAEDTRRLRRLAATLGVEVTGRVISYWNAVERQRSDQLLDVLRTGPGRAAGVRRGHAHDQRSRVPAGGGRGRRGRPDQGAARAVRGDRRAGRVRPAHRPVLLRGVPAAPRPASGPAASPSWPPSPGPWSSSRPPSGSGPPWTSWPRRSGPDAGRWSAVS